jgi:hypothetical protein
MNSEEFRPKSNTIVQAATEMHTDHEIQMARESCYRSASNAIELHRMLKHVSEQEGLDAWASEKISLANDYLRTVKEWLEYELMTKLENRVAENQFEVFESTYNKVVVAGDTAAKRKAKRDQQRTTPAKKQRDQAQRKGLTQDKDGTYYAKEGVAEGRSIKESKK